MTRRFESVVSGVQARPEPVGEALNRAANQVADEVAEWVG
jgi:cholesterol transport system auxiliary component